MKSILKTFNVGFISNFALIGILSALTSACGSDADSNDPRRYDTTGPEITLNTRPEVQDDDGNVTEYAIGANVELDIDQEYVELGAEARDVWDVNNLVDQDTQTEGVQPVLIEGTVNISEPGTYTISYTATDSSGNSNSKTRSIEVADRTGPVITISGPNPVTLDFGAEDWVPPAATFIDAFDADDENDTQTVTEISNPVDTNTINSYSVVYTAYDLAGNKSEATLTVIVEPDYQDQIVVFQNGAISDAWKPGMNGYDQDLSWGACNPTCPNIDFGLKPDPVKGRDVIYVDHAENDKQAGFFIQATTPSDLGGANINGKLSFEVWSENGVDLVTGVDCPAYPQVGNPYHLGIVGKGEWQEISIPAKDLFTDVCASRMDKIGTIPMFLNGYKGEEFRIDNIVWYCESDCSSENLDDKVYEPWVKADKAVGYVAPTSYAGYDLVWSDEFDGTEIDLTKWQLIDAGGGFGNSELQYYRPDNAYVENGLLVIETQIQKSTDAPLSPADESFSSAKLTTQDLFEFKHGRVDVRVAAAEGQGFWSAAWMLGANVDDIGWPFSGEVDIFESVGGVLNNEPQEGRMVHNAYWNADGPFAPGQYTTPRDYQRSSYSPTPGGGQLAWGERVINESNEGETFSNTFHVISIEWDEEKIRYFIDGVSVDGKDLNLNAGETCAYGQQPNEPQLTCLGQSFNHDFFLILNVAVGGTWPKAPDATTQWPRGMLVDYVRVYQTAAQQAAQAAE